MCLCASVCKYVCLCEFMCVYTCVPVCSCMCLCVCVYREALPVRLLWAGVQPLGLLCVLAVEVLQPTSAFCPHSGLPASQPCSQCPPGQRPSPSCCGLPLRERCLRSGQSSLPVLAIPWARSPQQFHCPQRLLGGCKYISLSPKLASARPRPSSQSPRACFPGEGGGACPQGARGEGECRLEARPSEGQAGPEVGSALSPGHQEGQSPRCPHRAASPTHLHLTHPPLL